MGEEIVKGKWRVESGKWKRQIRGFIFLGAVAFLFANPGWAAVKQSSCLECHQAIEGFAQGPAALFETDIHAHRGFTCADCHGGDPTASEQELAMDPAKGFIGRPKRQEIPQFCARCHADPSYMRRFNPNLPTDQYAKYLTSQHGKGNTAGDPDVAVCTSCHASHGIRSKKDPASPVYPTNIPTTCASCHSDAAIMQRHGLGVKQPWEYSQSVHGQALLFRGDRAAPHCASCHGSHEAAKPGAIAIGNVCAQCHSLQRDLFAASPHKPAHEALGMSECEVCHGNHLIAKPTDDLLGTGPDALCIQCHQPGSTGHATAEQMRQAIERLKTQLADAEAVVGKAARLGMDASDGEFEIREAHSKLTQARSYIHSFSITQLEPIVEEGTQHAAGAKTQGEQSIGEFHFRRHGLWITLVILTLLILGLVWKIRESERKQGPKSF
jgi:hypothetical protein